MAEELTQEQKDAAAAADAAKKLKEEEERQKGITIPKARFDEVNEAKKKLEDELAKRDADAKAEAEKKLVEEGKTKELLEIREAENAKLKLDILKRDLIQDAITNNLLHPKLSKMVVGTNEDELKASLADAIAYNKEVADTLKNDKTAIDKGAGGGNSDVKPLSTEEWMKMYKEDPVKANEYLAKLTEAKNNA